MSELPFSEDKLNEIFKKSPFNQNRLLSRESGWLEFKESFNMAPSSFAKYTKTCAAFANTKGGYLVFGIKNSPHEMIGMKNDKFETLDPEKLSTFFNEHFAPEIKYDISTHEIENKKFGLIYIFESEHKPVICKKSCGENQEIKESEIYYRYRGQTTLIKYSELIFIIDERRKKEEDMWIKYLNKIARIGVKDVGIFDLKSGLVTGKAGTVLIDEKLLSQISFIKEGHFSETEGDPTLKIIGEVQAISGSSIAIGKQIVKKGIRLEDIVVDFLKEEKVLEPTEYVKQICSENTGYLPVFYYIKLSKKSLADAIKIVEDCAVRSNSRKKLIETLSEGNKFFKELKNTGTDAYIRKKMFMENIKNESVDFRNLLIKDIKYCLQSINSLERKEIKQHKEFICEILLYFFNNYFSKESDIFVDNLKKAICWVDEAVYK